MLTGGRSHEKCNATEKYCEVYELYNTSSMCVCRAEVADTVENVDMSLEELQHLLLRSHQQNAVEAGTSAVMDVSRYLQHQADRCQFDDY